MTSVEKLRHFSEGKPWSGSHVDERQSSSHLIPSVKDCMSRAPLGMLTIFLSVKFFSGIGIWTQKRSSLGEGDP